MTHAYRGVVVEMDKKLPWPGIVPSAVRSLLTALTLFAIASATDGQEVPQFSADTRLRVTVVRPSGQVRIARFEALTDTSLVLSSNGAAHIIPLESISRLEWSSGRPPSIFGGVLGMIVGVAAGGAMACHANRDSYGVFCGGQDDTKMVVGAGLGGVAGAALGAFLLRRDQWISVDLSRLHPRRP